MLKIRCKNCNKEIESHPTQTHSCGCPNLTSVRNDVITANDLGMVEIISGVVKKKSENSKSFLSKEDLLFQEQRKMRKIKRLEFEIR